MYPISSRFPPANASPPGITIGKMEDRPLEFRRVVDAVMWYMRHFAGGDCIGIRNQLFLCGRKTVKYLPPLQIQVYLAMVRSFRLGSGLHYTIETDPRARQTLRLIAKCQYFEFRL